MKIVAGFPCYKRLHTPLVRSMIEQLLAQEEIDIIICGVTAEEYEEQRETLPIHDKLHYYPVVRGIGCGGDMAAVAEVMLRHSENGDILMFTDDDINFIEFPKHLKDVVYVYLKHDIVLYSMNEGNHFLRQEIGDNDVISVYRNKGPVFFVRREHFAATGNYDPEFHQANDVDIQQRFNIQGYSIVHRELRYKAGTFQEGGMSAFYSVQESRKKYQENTARALYRLKQKYPWLWKSSVSFKESGTSAVYRMDLSILNEYRAEFKQGKIALGPGGLYVLGKTKPMRWQLEDADKATLSRLEEMWNEDTARSGSTPQV